MKSIFFLLIITYSILLLGCGSNASVEGFWEGPHPNDVNCNFYIQIYKHGNDTLAKGFWIEDGHYNSTFDIKFLSFQSDSLCVFIPNWGCTYKGKIKKFRIFGGFSCVGEPYDTVMLVKNDAICDHLTDSKPNCKDENFKYKYEVPIAVNEEIETARYQSSGDSAFIHTILPEIIDGAYGRINSFLIIKNNKLICEEYFYGFTLSDLHAIESCTKSITSLIIGIAIDQKRIQDINQHLYEIFPEYPHLNKNNYKYLTVEYLLKMNSGYKVNDQELFNSSNRSEYAINRKLVNLPGKEFQYDGGNTEILGAIIKRKTGWFGDEFANENLFTPLGIQNYEWGNKQNGFPLMSGSLKLSPRDMTKIGVLILNNGKYKNKQIISEEWVKESTSFKTNTNFEDNTYGYQWWNLNFKSNDRYYSTIWANGWGSQFIYIIPSLNTVIVTTGYNYEYDSWAINRGIEKYLYLLDN